MTRRGVVFGAGAVGRGFIGEILADAGWHVTFVEASPELVSALREGHYPHDTVATSGTTRKTIRGCTAIDAREVDAVRGAVRGADVIFTSVGARNLPRVAPALAAGLADRVAMGPVDVFLAENLPDGASVMRDLLTRELASSGVGAAEVLARVGLVETSIGRMIPVPTRAQQREHAALVAVEPYRELPFDVSACRAPVPEIGDLVSNPEVDFAFYVERKLYVHNQGHCLTAYLGASRGHCEIAPAIGDERIRGTVRAAMHAAARALAAKYSQPEEGLVAHAEDLLARFANTALHDTVERVGRDPERKLQPGERFLGALELTAGWGDPEPVLPGLALASHQLALTRPGRPPAETSAAVRTEVRRLAPGLLERFDELVEGFGGDS